MGQAKLVECHATIPSHAGAKASEEVEQSPGIVLYTIVQGELIDAIERRCRERKVPGLHVLQPIMRVFETDSKKKGPRRAGPLSWHFGWRRLYISSCPK